MYKVFMSIRKASFIIILILIPVLSLTSCCYLPLKVQDVIRSEQNADGDSEPIEEIEFSGIPNSSLISNLKVSGQAIDVDISGNYAYLTNDLGILYIIDISNKGNPSGYY